MPSRSFHSFRQIFRRCGRKGLEVFAMHNNIGFSTAVLTPLGVSSLN